MNRGHVILLAELAVAVIAIAVAFIRSGRLH